MDGAAKIKSDTFGGIVQVLFWLVLFSSSIVFCLYILPWPDALFRSTLIISCHAINFYGFYYWIVPAWYKKQKYVSGLLVGILFIALLTPLRVRIANLFVLSEILVIQVDFLGRVVFIVFTELTIAGFAVFMRLASDEATAQLHVKELERLNLQSELRFLKAQMNPHFLFNTINNIYSLALSKSDKAPESLMRLSGLLRYLLYETGKKVTLGKETYALKAYADLFTLKYEQKIDLSIDIDADEKILIEPLILIPLLENALKHSGLGFEPKAYAIFKINTESNRIIIECENSKTLLPLASEHGGIGLANIRKRLEMAYADRYTFEISQTSVQFRLVMKLPVV